MYDDPHGGLDCTGVCVLLCMYDDPYGALDCTGVCVLFSCSLSEDSTAQPGTEEGREKTPKTEEKEKEEEEEKEQEEEDLFAERYRMFCVIML